MLLTEKDIYHFREGTYFRAYERLGAHPDAAGGATHFAVWAPNARAVSVLGDFNGWRHGAHPLEPRRDSSGIWEGSIPQAGRGARYKYAITARDTGENLEKSDPYALSTEVPPRTASVVWDLAYEWHDAEWMSRRAQMNALTAPCSIYEVHAGSWRRVPEEHGRWLGYRELAQALADYVTELG